MENTNLGSKMSNNKQNPDVEPVGANNIPETLKLNSEVEIDANGNETIVQRARNIAGTIPTIPQPTDKIQQEKEGLNRGVLTDKDTQKTIENNWSRDILDLQNYIRLQADAQVLANLETREIR